MKCREAEYWLYSLRPNTSWPAEVATHLQGCRDCQHLQARLKQVDAQINQYTCVPSNPPAKEQLLALIEKTPQLSLPRQPAPDAAWPWVRVVAFVAAAAALLFFGWLLGHHNVGEPREIVRTVEVVREKPVEVIREKIVTVESQADRHLFAALLKHNAQLVQSAQLKDRLEELLDMADECRKHALVLIEAGPRDSLPFTIDLYTQLLRDGVVVQVQQAPALKETARARLRKMADIGTAKPLPQSVEEQREALESVTRQSLADVEQPAQKLAPRLPPRFGPVAPAAALVQFAVAFSAEADPVAKADTCSQCVQRLTPFMMLHLADENGPERGDMGQQFGELIQFGIYWPLANAPTQEPPQPVKDQAERIIQTTFDTVSQMEKHLEVAPDRAKVAIERMLQASQKGKAKGPAWLHDPFATPKKGKSGNPGKGQKKASTETMPLRGHDLAISHAKAQRRKETANEEHVVCVNRRFDPLRLCAFA